MMTTMLRMPKNLAMFKFAFFDLEGYPRNNAATRRMEFNPNVDNMDYSNLLAINHFFEHGTWPSIIANTGAI